MAYTKVLDDIPSELVAGESISWSKTYSDYPASESWVLTYTLIKSDTQIQIVASDDGDDHLVEVATGVTAAYAVGTYDWQAHISNGTERYLMDVGVIKVVTDFATQASGFDSRSHNKIVLDALEAAIEGRASKTQLSQMVGKIQVQHMTLMEQTRLRDQYAARYRNELITAGKIKPRRTIKTRFI